MLYETYQRFSSVSARGRRLLLAFGPAALGGLVILWLVQLPLAWGLARRLREGQAERVALLRRAVDASERERRRVAHDLHDGAVQDLAGVSYSLAAVGDRLPPGEAADAVHAAAAETRHTIRELRSLLVDLYPPDLHRAGLEAALADLLAPLGKRGVDAPLELPVPLRLSPGIEALFYRSAQEALRNVLAHAEARRVDVSVVQENGTATLAIADDGRGFDPAERPEGHFGLQLLDDLARDSGGRLDVESAPGGGTRVRVEVPVT